MNEQGVEIMKHQLVSFAAWMNTDPRRFRFLSLSVMLALSLVVVGSPGTVTTLGLAAGGSD